jgi:hypothetical protein
MKDIRQHLEKLRVQTAECEMIRDLATDFEKRNMFARLAEHFRTLAGELETELARRTPSADSFLGHKTHEPFPNEDDTMMVQSVGAEELQPPK